MKADDIFLINCVFKKKIFTVAFTYPQLPSPHYELHKHFNNLLKAEFGLRRAYLGGFPRSQIQNGSRSVPKGEKISIVGQLLCLSDAVMHIQTC